MCFLVEIAFSTNLRRALFFHRTMSARGPLLFFILLTLLIALTVFCVDMLDHTCLLVDSPSLNELNITLNSEPFKITKWLVANKLTLNTNKSQRIIVSPKLHSPTIETNIQRSLESIKSVKSSKYLGVYINDNLFFEKHFENQKLLMQLEF